MPTAFGTLLYSVQAPLRLEGCSQTPNQLAFSNGAETMHQLRLPILQADPVDALYLTASPNRFCLHLPASGVRRVFAGGAEPPSSKLSRRTLKDICLQIPLTDSGKCAHACKIFNRFAVSTRQVKPIIETAGAGGAASARLIPYIKISEGHAALPRPVYQNPAQAS